MMQVLRCSVLCATAHRRGRTAHYMFGIPITNESMDIHSTIHLFSPRADLIWNATAIIWDELLMAKKRHGSAWTSIVDAS
ncbi:uncharacterized protein F5891DRAFT_1044468 [Suillus fuscotomentosus]|uniref:ATP-dependent DNA helicase n=1 Tax=Suillus fuscotomentosus TaxID=1912939 RepID=A0AAD4E4J7_9AGAM|nr:uncharacterized protein F5891DRAFT_1044468 [Suillus fuscotomentosus]KAG1898384.1 hypothetical protein F5891DRAFT_1044468 [Suillus fuscotomentosus]